MNGEKENRKIYAFTIPPEVMGLFEKACEKKFISKSQQVVNLMLAFIKEVEKN